MNHLLTALAAASLTALSAPATAQTEPGDEWQVTTEMQMGGMSMAPRTETVCSPRNSDEPPGVPEPENGDCEMYDIQRSANGMTWKMRCTGKEPATGTGELTWDGRDSYRGTMTMTMDEGSMTMKMAGKRTGAECDAGALKKQVAAMEQQTAEYQAQQCKAGVDSMMTMYFDGSFPMNCDPKFKADFCRRLGTEEGFDLVASRDVNATTGKSDLATAGSACGVDPEATRKKLCTDALQGESLVFAARHCEAEAAPLAQRECAGRTFTSPPAEKYREFCNTYARHGATGGAPAAGEAAPAPAAEPPKPDNPIDAGKKALKKLLPF
jgi:hypothetical protein